MGALERDNAQMSADVVHVREAAKSSERLAAVLRKDVARAQQVSGSEAAS